MSTPSFLLRFDDICPTMNWPMWERIEQFLVENNIRPILAVVPDNRDLGLVVGEANPQFWDRVRHWQAMQWTIALHGYQHVYVNRDPGIIGLTRHSEFAGLEYGAQKEKLTSAMAIFSREGVVANAWVAPSHSFDLTTVSILKELGIPVISDGLWRWPVTDERGIVWIPQQLWKMRSQRAGVWTICSHHNSWSDAHFLLWKNDIAAVLANVSSAQEIVERFKGRRRSARDRVDAWTAISSRKLRSLLWKAVRPLRTAR